MDVVKAAIPERNVRSIMPVDYHRVIRLVALLELVNCSLESPSRSSLVKSPVSVSFDNLGLAIAHELEQLASKSAMFSTSATSSMYPRVAAKMLTTCSVDAQRLVLRLLEQFDHAVTAVESSLSGWVQFGSQLGEGFQFAERSQVQSQAAGDLLHGFDLGAHHPRGRPRYRRSSRDERL
jgi:hypothetical protein